MAKQAVKLAGNTIEPGERGYGFLHVNQLVGGTEVRVPYQVINGAHEGPTLCLESTMHGWEPMPAEAIRRAMLQVDPATLRCPDNGALVDITSCQTRGERGAGELMVAWQDEDFDASQGAFHYVRAIQNPTCRWSTYDAIRLGIEPDPRVPATIRERAWSSPIWIDPPS